MIMVRYRGTSSTEAYMGKQKSKIDTPLHVTHDTFFKKMFQMPSLAVAFLKKVLPAETLEWLNLEKLTIETNDFVDDYYRKTYSDMVYKIPIIGEDEYVCVHVIMEHKSQNDLDTIFQIGKYVHQLSLRDVEARLTDPETKKRKPWTKDFRISPIIAIILHHGVTPFFGKLELADLFYPLPGAVEFFPHQKAILVDLSAMKAEEIPRDAAVPELHIVLLIMQTITSKDDGTLSQKLDEILEELRPISDVPLYAKLIRDFWFYTTYNVETLEKEDVNELEIKVREMIGEKTMPSIAQMYINEGMEIGFTQGEAIGEARGEARAILRTLARRFRFVPQSLEEQILAIHDLARLDQLAEFAFDCGSLDEFEESLK